MPPPQDPLRVIRHEDLLVLEFRFTNLQVSGDGTKLERLDNGALAAVTVVLPFQHVAESAFLEFENDKQAAGPPPVGAFAAGPTRLVFTLPDGVSSIPYSPAGLLKWA